MFVSIREEDIRRNCPEYAPMTLQVLNKLYPVEEDTFETTGRLKQLPRMVYAPSSIQQLSQQITRLNLNPSASSSEVRVNEQMVEKQILEKIGIDEQLDLLSQLPDVPRPVEEEEEENLDNIRAVSSYMDNLFSRTFREVSPVEEEKIEEIEEITEPATNLRDDTRAMVVVDEFPRDVTERPPRADKGVSRGPQRRTIEKAMMGAEDFDAFERYPELPLPGPGY